MKSELNITSARGSVQILCKLNFQLLARWLINQWSPLPVGPFGWVPFGWVPFGWVAPAYDVILLTSYPNSVLSQNGFSHKSSKTNPINFKFGQELHITKTNDFWNFGENPTSWRHLTSFSKFWWRHHQKWWRQQNWAKDTTLKCIIL